VRRLREQAGPTDVLVAVGGVTFETAPEILAAGASVVGVSAAIFRTADSAAEFRRWVGALK
jgi:thiamine monophosphate synthase